MTVQNVIDLARNGELKNIAVRDDVSAVLGFINLGLIEMYKRFPIKTEEHIIELQDGVDVYTMPDDFMWIVAAYDEVDEDSDAYVKVMPINEEDNPLSLNTIAWNKVQLSVSILNAYISVIYVAAPPVFTEADLEEELPLPPQMVEALLHYIGYRGHGSVDGNIQAENSTHYQRFEASCQRIRQEGMITPDDLNMSGRLGDRGFV